MTTQESASLVVICINAGALVWGAAKLSSSVTFLNEKVEELRIEGKELRKELAEFVTELTRLQAEWDGRERRKA